MLIILSATAVNAQDNAININGINFKIPDEYVGGDNLTDGYRYENIFSIRCIDDNIGNSIGLWAIEADYRNDLTISNHPVRHYCQYNRYVWDNHSHLYFASGDSFYEISWVGDNITPEIKKLINNTPKSKISGDAFNKTLDESIDIYKQEKIDRLNSDSKYIYAKSDNNDDNSRFREILLTYYNNH